jgi:alkyl hydroperoxide reductase subunit AhpF
MTDGAKPLLKSNGSQARFNMGTNMENQKRKKVLVVGAGAAGTCKSIDLARQTLTRNQACHARTTSRTTPTNST